MVCVHERTIEKYWVLRQEADQEIDDMYKRYRMDVSEDMTEMTNQCLLEDIDLEDDHVEIMRLLWTSTQVLSSMQQY